MDHKVKFDTVNYDVYKNAKPSRPAWATALIVALLLVIAGVFAVVTLGFSPFVGLMFGGAFVTLLIAGVLALAGIKKA